MRYFFTLFFIISIGYSQTTLCYKNNHNNPATIEQQLFDGGKCEGNKSIEDMKLDGWSIKDIKLSQSNDNMNYIYILNKSTTTSPTTKDLDYTKITQGLTEYKEKESKKEELIKGKKYYINTCQECHGEKGESITLHKTSRPLNTMSLEDMQMAIIDYNFDDYDRGWAIIMKPYAKLVMKSEIKAVHSYLQSINK
ncbi:MAG: hypothetical protein U9R37_00370 [Campylobacterota bacterium]|nr:hypothetical protein [Campylobacterota bacterium]